MYTIKTSESCLVRVFFGREFPGIDLLFSPLMCLTQDYNLTGGVFQKSFSQLDAAVMCYDFRSYVSSGLITGSDCKIPTIQCTIL